MAYRTGTTGATGATGPDTTSTSMNAINTDGDTINVIVAGTNVPLPTQPFLDGFTVNGANDTFTVPTTGTYLVTYDVKTTTALLMSSEVLLNGTAIANSVVSPTVATDNYNATFIQNLTAGDTLTLELFGLLGAAILQSGNGASLTVIRIA